MMRSEEGKTVDDQSIVKEIPASAIKGFFVALMYGLISISCIFFNKAVLSYYGFKYSSIMTLGQNFFSFVLLLLLNFFRLIHIPTFNFHIAKQVFPLTILFFLNVIVGLAALRLVNIPMFSALRRLTALFVMIGEGVFLGKYSSLPVKLSVFTMLSGAMIAFWGDLTFDLLGYLLVFANNLISATYLVFIKFVQKNTQLDSFAMLYYNSLLSIPFVLFLILTTGEIQQLPSFPFLFDPGFQMAFLVSCIQVFLLNYSVFLCTTVNSPLTTTITGQLKNVVTTFLGMFVFGDVKFQWTLVSGLGIGVCGSFGYSYSKFLETKKAVTS